MPHHHESNHQDVLLSVIRILIKFLNKNDAYTLTRSIGKKYCETILGIVRSTYYHNYFRIPDTFYNSQHYDQITHVCEYAAIYDPRQRRKEHLQKISYNDRFNEEIKPGDIPDTVTVLSFGQSFNTRLEPGVLPKNLKSLKSQPQS